jgi:tight adherence protein B
LRSPAPKRGAEYQADAASRRKQIAESLKEVEARGKPKRQSLEARIAEAGISWSRNKYITASLASAALYGGLMLMLGDGPDVRQSAAAGTCRGKASLKAA